MSLYELCEHCFRINSPIPNSACYLLWDVLYVIRDWLLGWLTLHSVRRCGRLFVVVLYLNVCLYANVIYSVTFHKFTMERVVSLKSSSSGGSDPVNSPQPTVNDEGIEG